MVSTAVATTGRSRQQSVLLALVALAIVLIGLSWAKWLPYADRVAGLASGGSWPGTSILTAGSGENPFVRAWTFTWAYTEAVWKALAVALVVSACLDVLLPKRWLLHVLDRRSTLSRSMAGGLAALPGMMCTCCCAPLTVTMRRAGVPVPAALAFWLGNPVLNPAVLVFLAFLAPPSWVAVRIVLGVLLVFGFSALIGALVARRMGSSAVELPAADQALAAAQQAEPTTGSEIARRLLRSLTRMVIVLVPEYLIVVYLVGLFGEPLGQVLGHGGFLAVLIAAVVGAVLVLPTGGEIPIVLGLAAAGASAGVLGALLLALPAISLPSFVMVGRALGWRVTAAAAGATVAAALLAGGVLALVA